MIVDIVIRETPEGEVIHYLLSEDEREFDLRGLLFEDEVTDCDWLDEEQRFLVAAYNDWEGKSNFAILSLHGELLRKGIRQIRQYIPEQRLFIIEQTGASLGEDRFDYQAEEDDILFAVMNDTGNYVIEPQPEQIFYNEQETAFGVGSGQEWIIYDLKGKRIS